ncbi:hypothetical protein M3Y97_00434300 [Aphelenchoides bicaudatus]|nr:hypothetical protein M3Y97_00434300 [Aphelenchoides bicaudatus]
MLSLGVRSSLLAGRYVLNVEKLLSTSAVLCNGGAKIYKSTRERELLSEYKAHGKNKVIRFEKTTPEDIPLLVDFMSEICERQEPTSVSIGVTADEFKPFTAKIAEEGINYSLVFIDEDRVIGAGIGNVVTLDPKTAIEPRILGNYGEIIDAMADWLPSRKMRRVVAPAYELCNMVSHFLPKDVKKVMRYELCCVDKRAVGSNLINKCIYEVTMMGLRDGIKYGDVSGDCRSKPPCAHKERWQSILPHSIRKDV